LIANASFLPHHLLERPDAYGQSAAPAPAQAIRQPTGKSHEGKAAGVC
jgi:hypothetical protein